MFSLPPCTQKCCEPVHLEYTEVSLVCTKLRFIWIKVKTFSQEAWVNNQRECHLCWEACIYLSLLWSRLASSTWPWTLQGGGHPQFLWATAYLWWWKLNQNHGNKCKLAEKLLEQIICVRKIIMWHQSVVLNLQAVCRRPLVKMNEGGDQ